MLNNGSRDKDTIKNKLAQFQWIQYSKFKTSRQDKTKWILLRETTSYIVISIDVIFTGHLFGKVQLFTCESMTKQNEHEDATHYVSLASLTK